MNKLNIIAETLAQKKDEMSYGEYVKFIKKYLQEEVPELRERDSETTTQEEEYPTENITGNAQ